MTCLIPAGGDPHQAVLRPRDRQAIADASLVLLNGYGLTPALTRISGGAPKVAVAEQAVPASPGRDPHVWHDPAQAAAMVRVVEARLATLLPSGSAAAVKRRGQAATAVLADLSRWIEVQIDTVPTRSRVLVTEHRAFSSLARRFGVRELPLLASFTTAGVLRPASLVAITKAVRESGTRQLFAESLPISKTLRRTSRASGVPVNPTPLVMVMEWGLPNQGSLAIEAMVGPALVWGEAEHFYGRVHLEPSEEHHAEEADHHGEEHAHNHGGAPFRRSDLKGRLQVRYDPNQRLSFFAEWLPYYVTRSQGEDIQGLKNELGFGVGYAFGDGDVNFALGDGLETVADGLFISLENRTGWESDGTYLGNYTDPWLGFGFNVDQLNVTLSAGPRIYSPGSYAGLPSRTDWGGEVELEFPLNRRTVLFAHWKPIYSSQGGEGWGRGWQPPHRYGGHLPLLIECSYDGGLPGILLNRSHLKPPRRFPAPGRLTRLVPASRGQDPEP